MTTYERKRILEEAIEEAARFIRKAQEAKRKLDEITEEHSEHYPVSSPETAAAKRASMDLTRALVFVRQ